MTTNHTSENHDAYIDLYKYCRRNAAENIRYLKSEAKYLSVNDILYWSETIRSNIAHMNAYKQQALNIENERR